MQKEELLLAKRAPTYGSSSVVGFAALLHRHPANDKCRVNASNSTIQQIQDAIIQSAAAAIGTSNESHKNQLGNNKNLVAGSKFSKKFRLSFHNPNPSQLKRPTQTANVPLSCLAQPT